MRRLWAALSLVAVVAAIGVASGCVDSSEEAAQTPSGASTVNNTAVQTDSEGNFVTAPPAEPGGETAAAEGGAPGPGGVGGGGGGGAEAKGDVAAGQEFFTQTCQSCHLNGGQEAGVGPQLAGMGLDAATIEHQVVNGGGAMPPGLATGADLDNVVAYVVSIQ